MPRGDGTGPFGSGPLNKGSQGSGRGLGGRRNMNNSKKCPRDSRQGGGLNDNRDALRAGGLLQGAVMKLLNMTVVAIPALLKARNLLQAPERQVLSDSKDTQPPTIDITPVQVEETKKLK